MTPILMLGAGRMGGALIEGWRAAGAFQSSDLIVREPFQWRMGARLLGPRAISADRLATAAIATGDPA